MTSVWDIFKTILLARWGGGCADMWGHPPSARNDERRGDCRPPSWPREVWCDCVGSPADRGGSAEYSQQLIILSCRLSLLMAQLNTGTVSKFTFFWQPVIKDLVLWWLARPHIAHSSSASGLSQDFTKYIRQFNPSFLFLKALFHPSWEYKKERRNKISIVDTLWW